MEPWHGYLFVSLVFYIILKPQPIEHATSTSHAEESKKLKDNNEVIIIGCVVGVIMLIVIVVGQAIALQYFRKRARAQKRMENLQNARQPFDRGNEARYSAPPNRRSLRPNRENADTDSHIYEMVGINSMYNADSQTDKITDIKDRPPLPLPGEAYEEPDSLDSLPRPKPKLATSTLSLEAADAGDPAPPPRPAKKDPPVPTRAVLPKPALQKDEPPSLPGSLRRPPKPAAKTGSITKNMAIDPAITELKKVLEKRKVETTVPQTSTPAEKKAPQIPAKKAQPEKPNKKPVGVIPPLSPQDTETTPPTSSNSRTSTLKANLETAFKPKTELPTSTMPARLPQIKPELPASTMPARLPQIKPEQPTSTMPARLPQIKSELPASTMPARLPQIKPELPASSMPARLSQTKSELPTSTLPARLPQTKAELPTSSMPSRLPQTKAELPTSSMPARLPQIKPELPASSMPARLSQTKSELPTSSMPAKLPQTKAELPTSSMPARLPQTKAELPTSSMPARLPQTTKPVLPSPSKAAPVLPYRPLPPIQAEEVNEEDDDEWTYEPLDKFNIYNV